jgi:predicted Fe-Mo cluster-binding NifX family protein
MKIAIATENNDPSAEISSQGARALFYLVFGTDGQMSEILENPYASNATRVGPDVADMLINMQVTKVIAGRFGPKFREALESNRVECIEQTGFAAQAAKEHFD